MSAIQAELFSALPPGLAYRPELISPVEERALIAELETLSFKPFEFRGFLGRREVAYFGWRYDFDGRALSKAEEIPDFLRPLRDAAAGFAGVEPAAFVHALVNRYEPGAPIGWHRDRPEFGIVAGVSLLSPARFRLRRRRGAGFERAEFIAEPRSAYLLAGAAREAWEHSIPPHQALRYSVTFRTLREPQPQS